eukprot:GHVL01019639.1.p1 GENE.GHVL01019639.1~~GHVL01019639.1.p1  ORF type:complete len:228 (-),score=47.22 GHVL01019639.1:35-718(-)
MRCPFRKDQRVLTLTHLRKRNPRMQPPRDIWEDTRPPPFRHGTPLLEKTFDINNYSHGCNKKYQTSNPTNYFVNKNRDESNFHEMMGKFRFSITGRFDEKGLVYEKEIAKATQDLGLVGWVKIRKKEAIGHLQGDVYALSYMRRWLSEYQPGLSHIENFDINSDSYGIPVLDYRLMKSVKDWRKPRKIKAHLSTANVKIKLKNLRRESRRRSAIVNKFRDENSIRNY